MPLPSPKLDDRLFRDLVDEATRLIRQKGTAWNDLSPSDPGMVLLELFAHLTEVMLYRLNRLPEKAFIAFLNLLGVTLQPPSAASVTLRFYRSRDSAESITIPRGTRVTVGRSSSGQEPPIFMTAEAAVILPGSSDVLVRAYHCEQIESEAAGRGTGLPGQTVQVRRPPVIAPTGDPLDLVVGVEAQPDELDERIPAIQAGETTYRIWREVPNFTNVGDDPHVYVVDRHSGIITFAPALYRRGPDGLDETATALAAVPGADRLIRLWYRRGGGPAGNVAADQLTTMKDPIAGVKVTNPERATGGRSAETVANALQRGPQELHSLQRAVTAKDFELIARAYSSRAVARAKAFTRAALWQHAAPGHVEVLLVPDVPGGDDERLTLELLQAHETEPALRQIRQALDERRPLGTTCVVNWARYKRVKVRATVVVQREEDSDAIRERIARRLYQTIAPVPTALNSGGWPFGQALRASNVYDAALAEPGVRWVDRVRLVVEEVPDGQVRALAIDHFQPHTWYAGSETTLFRSLNDGEGWEAIGRTEAAITAIEAHPDRPGYVALASQRAGEKGARVVISADCGETWDAGSFVTAFDVYDLAWTQREGEPVLLLATDVGLYEIVVRPGGSPVQILVDAQDQDRGFYAVVAYTDLRGISSVAVAAQGLGGVYLSSAGGRPGTFRPIAKNLPAGEDVRVLAVQYDGPRAFLWAGVAAVGGDSGHGCFRWELRGTQDPPEGWVAFGRGWEGGSCRGLAFHGSQAFAATHRLGVVVLDSARDGAAWTAPALNCGLPLREREQQRLFHPIDAVAASRPAEARLVMAGSVGGVYRSADGGQFYSASSSAEFIEKVTVPETWLFVSGDHEITVVPEDEAR